MSPKVKASRLIKATGWLFAVTAFLVILPNLIIGDGVFTNVEDSQDHIFLIFIVLVLLFFSGFSFYTSARLMKYSDNLSKIYSYLVSIIAILYFPIGSIIGVLIIYYLISVKE